MQNNKKETVYSNVIRKQVFFMPDNNEEKEYILMYRISSKGGFIDFKDKERILEILNNKKGERIANSDSIKSRIFSYRYRYLSDLSLKLGDFKNFVKYLKKSVKFYPLVIFEQFTIKSFVKGLRHCYKKSIKN